MRTKFVLVFILLFISNFSFAQEKSFIREYTHTVGDADSKITSRAIALNQVKKILLEEIGVYIESTFEIETTEVNLEIKELTKNQIISITAGITETKILDEKWNGIEFYIKAEITINPIEVKTQLAEIAKDRDKTKQLEEANNRTEQAIAKLNKIRTELNKTNSEKEKLKLQLEYATNANILTALDWFYKGNKSVKLEKFDKAIEHYKKAIELDPNLAEAYFNIGLTYFIGLLNGFSLEEIDRDWYYQKAIELYPNNEYGFLGKGAAYKLMGNYDDALRCYQTALELNPNNAEIYVQMGTFIHDRNMHIAFNINSDNYWDALEDYDESIIFYQKAIKLDPKYSKAYFQLGYAYDQMGKDDDAIICYLKASELDKNNADGNSAIGAIYENKGNYEKAIEHYKYAIEIDATNHLCYEALGKLYGKLGLKEKTIFANKKIVELLEELPNREFQITSLTSDIANAYLSLNEYEKAIDYINDVLLKHPEYGFLLRTLGKIYYKYGDLEKSIETFNQSIELGTSVVIDYCNIGYIMAKQGNYRQAIEHYQTALILLENAEKNAFSFMWFDKSDLLSELGNLYLKLGDYDIAIEYLKNAIESNISESEKDIEIKEGSIELNYNFIAENYASIQVCYIEKDDYHKASIFLKKAVKNYLFAIENEKPQLFGMHYYEDIGNAYNNNFEYDKAIKYYKMAPRSSQKIAHVYANKGDYDKAIEYCESKIKSSPNHSVFFSSEFYNFLGSLHDKKGNKDIAINYYLKADSLKIANSVDKTKTKINFESISDLEW